MNDVSILGVLILGLIGGGLLGYLIGGLRRELFDRNLRHANTRLRSLELDRDLLAETLDITRRELDDLRTQTTAEAAEPAARKPTYAGASPAIAARMQTLEITKRQLEQVRAQGRDVEVVIDDTDKSRAQKTAPKVEVRPRSRESVKADEPAKNPRRRPPKKLPAEVEEPDPATLPDLEYPKVRFG
jgi:hypothetical protein